MVDMTEDTGQGARFPNQARNGVGGQVLSKGWKVGHDQELAVT